MKHSTLPWSIFIGVILQPPLVLCTIAIPPGYTWRQGDCGGNDITSFSTKDVYLCSYLCNKYPSCVCFQLNTHSSKCFLKRRSCTSTAFYGSSANMLDKTDSAMRNVPYKKSTTRPSKGTLLKTVSTRSSLSCSVACVDNTSCNAYAYDDATKMCYLIDTLKSTLTLRATGDADVFIIG
ncbi:uncharacterized protein LOC135485746 [Lineus longissimus]|uniref:uncharacterized protein LOC135485746 n=1 Tax=Lineus longissimus TaxID=88925 RepID=UPI00315DA587